MKTIAALILAIGLCASGAWAGGIGKNVEVRILTDDGRILPTYPVKLRQNLTKVYAEAVKGDHYRIQVRNRLDRRVGLVIAVDGRNIISGDKSWLRYNERMYILEPYGSGEFTGWRTAQDRINRFYFTDLPDSYAAAFGDESAMGVIAVAAYPEQRRYEPPVPISQAPSYSPRGYGSNGAGAADRSGSPKGNGEKGGPFSVSEIRVHGGRRHRLRPGGVLPLLHRDFRTGAKGCGNRLRQVRVARNPVQTGSDKLQTAGAPPPQPPVGQRRLCPCPSGEVVVHLLKICSMDLLRYLCY
jgi:hypothetical protein